MWPGKAVVKLTAMYSRAYSIGYKDNFSKFWSLDDKELYATLGLVPLINRRKLHILFLGRKCLDGSASPYLNDCFNLNTTVHTFTTRRFNDIHLPKVNLQVAKRFFYFTSAMEFVGLPRHSKSKESFIEFSRDPKDFLLIRSG